MKMGKYWINMTWLRTGECSPLGVFLEAILDKEERIYLLHHTRILIPPFGVLSESDSNDSIQLREKTSAQKT